MAKDLAHPLEHVLEAGIEPGLPAVQKKDNGVNMVDHIGKGVHHLLNQDLIIVVRISEARGVDHLKELFYEKKLFIFSGIWDTGLIRPFLHLVCNVLLTVKF